MALEAVQIAGSNALRIDKVRALDELESDWTTSMELAETLQHSHRTPFRVGHHVASEVVRYAKANKLLPEDFPHAQAQRLYADALQHFKLPAAPLPMDDATFRRTLSPAEANLNNAFSALLAR